MLPLRAQFYLRVKMNNRFIIPLNELTAGENVFIWQIGKEFFDSFDNSEILDAHLVADVKVDKSSRCIRIDCDVRGNVIVECDRCLDELDMPVGVGIRLSVKYGSGEQADDMQDGEREVVLVPEVDAELDMGQIIYDYVCLSLPMQRVHPAGGCNPDAMKYYSAPEGFDVFNEEGEMNPFSVLKDMFK